MIQLVIQVMSANVSDHNVHERVTNANGFQFVDNRAQWNTSPGQILTLKSCWTQRTQILVPGATKEQFEGGVWRHASPWSPPFCVQHMS